MPLIKICGLRSTDAATHAIACGADILGFILVPGRKRTVAPELVAESAQLAWAERKRRGRRFQTASELVAHVSSLGLTSPRAHFRTVASLVAENGPFVVGVFCNQLADDVFAAAARSNVDFIQLHGDENVDAFLARNSDLRYAFIKRYVLPDHAPHMAQPARGFAFPLLDSELGGEGVRIDWSLISGLDGAFMLAGGLTPENLPETAPYLDKVFGFDVSTGVEDAHGDKDPEKVRRFVSVGKQVLTAAETART